MIRSCISKLKCSTLIPKKKGPLNNYVIKRDYSNGKKKIIDELSERGLITAVTRY